MIVCHCFKVNDKTIKTLIVEGAKTIDDIQRSCNAGKGCGGCIAVIEEMIDELEERRNEEHKTNKDVSKG